jgi:citrate lyase beta subunit
MTLKKPNCNPWQLGAPLYIPALHSDVLSIANNQKNTFIRTLIICTEDAVAEHDVEASLRQLHKILPLIDPTAHKYRFIRPRNPSILERLLQFPGIDHIDGFVLPKFDLNNYSAYLDLLKGSRFKLMPTLETAAVFDAAAMRDLAKALSQDKADANILMLRIGGNDLLNLLGLRRPRHLTLYDTPLATIIPQLVTTFVPLGLLLSAPVYDYLNDAATLNREIHLDLAHGLIGKTAIHPKQIALIEQHYAVSREDYEMARSIIGSDAPAVFKMHDAMCEVATHHRWAQHVTQRHDCFGEIAFHHRPAEFATTTYDHPSTVNNRWFRQVFGFRN